MPVVERTGSIFTTHADVIVNTVNCAGAMGAGIALEVRRRYPAVFRRYEEQCDRGEVTIGRLHLDQSIRPWILNFPTKKHWRLPSRPEYIRAGLRSFIKMTETADFASVAFPLLGASHGGLDPNLSRALLLEHLAVLPIDIEIWRHDATAEDDLIALVREAFAHESDRAISAESGLNTSAVRRIREVLPQVPQLGHIAETRGLGETSIERLFAFAMARRAAPSRPRQSTLDMLADSHEPSQPTSWLN